MRLIKLERAESFIRCSIDNRCINCDNIKEFNYDGKRGYALPECAIRFIDMYSISFLDNALLNKIMLKVAFGMCETIFILFSPKVNNFGLSAREESFISELEVRGWSEKRLSKGQV